MRRYLTVFLTGLISIGSVYSDPYPERKVGPYVHFQGTRLQLISKFIPENPVIFESGGHYGEDTLEFCKQWPKSKIITFEPNPHAFGILTETIKGHSNVHPYSLAVADFNGSATFYICYGTNGDEEIFEGASSLLEPSEAMAIHYQGP
jgi:hypothetical protein